MIVSELITALEAIKQQAGDLPVTLVFDTVDFEVTGVAERAGDNTSYEVRNHHRVTILSGVGDAEE